MYGIHPQQVPPADQPPFIQDADLQLRIRVNAELQQIRDEIRECDLTERNVGPVADLITPWYLEFQRFARFPQRGEVMPNLNETVARFRHLLENLLADPFNVDRPYPPQLFGELPTRIVRFMVAKAADPTSILFSQLIYAAKPAPAPVVAIPEDFEEQLRMIQALRAQRLQEQEQELPGFQEARRQIQQIEAHQRENLAAVGEQFQVGIAPLAEAIPALEVNIPRQEGIIRAAIGRQQERLGVLQMGLVVLEADRGRVGEGIVNQQQADLDLRISTNRLEQSIEKKKEEQSNQLLLVGGLLILSSAVTWGLSSYYYGMSASLMQCSKVFLGAGISLGAAGISHQSNKYPTATK
jgi:hypothetical protein